MSDNGLNAATRAFAAGIADQLSAGALRTDLAPYLQEPRGKWQGQGPVLAPANTAEVAVIVKACAQARVGVVPYGGGTGLVSGQVKPQGAAPLVLSLERLNVIRSIHASENVVVAEAGVILADVHSAALEVDRLFPLSLASEGSARIGGLLSTNAGGLNVLRYGTARAQCLGLEVVRADGSIWNGLTRLYKDNTGYDLRDLFIGAEGSLGVITAAALKLAPRPAEVGTAMLQVTSPTAALDVLAMARGMVGDAISGFELIHQQGPDFLAEVGPEVKAPFEKMPDWVVLIEVGLPSGMSASATLETLFEAAVEAGLSDDGVIAASEAQRTALWNLRESIPEANRRIGSIASHDIALPLSAIPDFIEKGKEAIGALGDFRINCFGHLGDGNLHYNVYPPKGQSRGQYAGQGGAITRTIHDLVAAFDGSISAEHGIGRLKAEDLERYASREKLQMMRALKTAFDPQGIMNPGAVLR